MDNNGVKKFMAALKAANITKYSFDTDLGTHYYNNENSIVFLDYSNDLVYNIRSNHFAGSVPAYEGDFAVYASEFEDIHEVRCGGTLEQIHKFIESAGLTLSDEQKQVLVDINSKNKFDIEPLTGDYHKFVELSEEEYNKLTPDEKEKYDKLKAKNDGTYLAPKRPVRVNVR